MLYILVLPMMLNEGRVHEHKLKVNPKAFTTLYNCIKLVHIEDYNRIEQAIAREKQLKNWHRDWKLNLIKEENPELKDLAHDWPIDELT